MVMPGTLRSASASELPPCASVSALGTTVTDCGTSRRFSGSFEIELLTAL